MTEPTYMDQWREAVWSDDSLTSTETLVLLALGRFANWHNGEDCRPGAAALIRLTRLSRSCVLRTIAGLEVREAADGREAGKGWLLVRSRGQSLPGKQRTTTVYRLVIPRRTVGTGAPVAQGLQAPEDMTVLSEPRTVGTGAPYHLSTSSEISSSPAGSTESPPADDPSRDDDLEQSTRQRIAAAASILGRHDHDRARLAGIVIADQTAYRRTCIARRNDDPGLIALAHAEPDLDGPALAERIENDPTALMGRPASRHSPVDATIAATQVRMAANAEWASEAPPRDPELLAKGLAEARSAATGREQQ